MHLVSHKQNSFFVMNFSASFKEVSPVFLREALDKLQHAAVCHQVQGTLALVVCVADVSTFLR